MKFSKSILILAIAILGFASCNKDDVASKNGLEGTWVGNWGFDFDTPTNYEKWVIKKNGDMVVYDEDGDVIAEGSCSANGVDFLAEYTPTGKDYSYTFSGLYSDVAKEIIGTWGETPSIADGGTFEMFKQ